MEYLAFVLWTVLYPVASSLTSYIGAKERKISSREPASDTALGIAAIINVLIWAGVAKILYDQAL